MAREMQAKDLMALLARPELSEKRSVFVDRVDAGQVLASLVDTVAPAHALVLAIPAGGVPVAAEVARACHLELDVAVVSKITFPWNSESGYGAIAFDGTVVIDDDLVHASGLSQEQVATGIVQTRTKVQRRSIAFRRGLRSMDVRGRSVVLVDDGLASGITMRAALRALRRADVEHIIVAVPTAHEAAINALGPDVDEIVAANVRSGRAFSVAAAYRNWTDVDENDAIRILDEARESIRPSAPL
jgi:putative phosphoribosyl transferase